MNNTMSYKGYYGSVEFTYDDNVFFGKIIGINDRITYEGDTVKTLQKNFEEAVDDYLDVCTNLGKTPDKTYKGTFNVRINPNLHRQLALYSSSIGKTLNSVVEEAIQNYLV